MTEAVSTPLFSSCIAGSLPKPAWLSETNKLWPQWKQTGDELLQAKLDATLLWIKTQEDAGIDVIGDGEQSRQHFVHGFLEQVEGIDFANKVTMGIRNNRYDAQVPQVIAPLRLKGRVHAAEAQFRTDLLNTGTNNTEFASRFLVGNPGSVGTFGNTLQLGGFTGVGGLTISAAAGNFSCTGSLIARDIVLTAAHCLPGNISNIVFQQPSNRPSNFANQINPGPITQTVASGFVLHPGYNQTLSVGGGNDIALIKLRTPVAAGDIYSIYRGNNERFVDHIKVGAGSSGWGIVGNDVSPAGLNVGGGSGFFDGRKRAGYNQYEAYGKPFFDAVTADELTASGVRQGGPDDGVLLYDFDSGLAINDVFGNLDVYTQGPGATGSFQRAQTGVRIGDQTWEDRKSVV